MANNRVRDYFIRKQNPDRATTIRADLWNSAVSSTQFDKESDRHYHLAVMEQYKLYVEMADRVSSRRGLANTFFLTLNTAVFVLIGVFWEAQPNASETVLLFPLIALLAQCLAWFWTIRSYRQLNSAKLAVVGELERRLPALAYSDAEWSALGRGKDAGIYWPLTQVESVTPILFALTYLGAFLAALAA